MHRISIWGRRNQRDSRDRFIGRRWEFVQAIARKIIGIRGSRSMPLPTRSSNSSAESKSRRSYGHIEPTWLLAHGRKWKTHRRCFSYDGNSTESLLAIRISCHTANAFIFDYRCYQRNRGTFGKFVCQNWHRYARPRCLTLFKKPCRSQIFARSS